MQKILRLVLPVLAAIMAFAPSLRAKDAEHFTYVAFVPKDKSAEERAKTDKSWQRAAARGWTIRTFPGTHVAMVEDPRGIASLMEELVGDINKPVAAAPAPAPAK